ncbi:MAG: hypothetical protein JST67_12000 [Bacteroidetes bacterium]|nr:hypothetical protein [Bacteroidota bacterium]
MRTLDEHRIKLKEICDFAFAFGIRSVQSQIPEYSLPDTWSEEIKHTFLLKCHEGFKSAQDLIVEEILEYQKLLREFTTDLKESRRQRDKNKEKDLLNKIAISEHRVKTFSHIADGIAWQLISGQIHIARRLYIREPAKYLDSSNIKHAISVANQINQKPENFALLSDITNFVQIGDLLIRHDKKVGIMELKEGKVNDLIAKFFDDLEKEENKSDLTEFMQKLDKKTIEQMQRVLRQKERAIRAIDVINKDKGLDPKTGKNITVTTPSLETEYYYEDLFKIKEQLKDKNWAYGVLENASVHIGMYKNDGRLMAPFAIKEILSKKTKNFIVVDFQGIIENVSSPLFAKPFNPDFLIDILVGDIKVIIGIDFDSFIEMFNDSGLNARWLSEKETTKIRQDEKTKTIFALNNRAIGISDQKKSKEIILGGGIISKILYDNIYPSNIAFTMKKDMFGDDK